MHVAITSGPSREAVDDVRYLSNVSTGRLGVAVSDAFLAAGARVTLVHGAGAQLPHPRPGLACVEFGSAADLLAKLEALAAGPEAPAVLIHAAAVADYRPEKVEGKIKSDRAELVLRLVPTPKVADRLHEAFPDLPMILFKLESGIPRDELHRRARATMARAGGAAIVANLLGEVTETAHRADLLRADGSCASFASREELAGGLVLEAESLARRAARTAGGAR